VGVVWVWFGCGYLCGVIREGMMDELKGRAEGQEAAVPGILNTP